MKKKGLVLLTGTLALILFSGMGSPCRADEESSALQAEQAGRLQEALNHYVGALHSAPEGSSKDLELREKIIGLARQMPPPAIPEEAERHMLRGEAAVEIAKDRSGFAKAADEFKAALRIAPWLAAGYFNLSMVQEKAGDYAGAIRNARLYLLAAPQASDADAVRKRIVKLEYKQEQTEATVRAERDKKAQIASLSGTWEVSYWIYDILRRPDLTSTEWKRASGDAYAKVLVDNDAFEATVVSGNRPSYVFRGKIQGNRIQGKFFDVSGSCERLCGKTPPPSPLEGEISPQKNTILLVVRGSQLLQGGNCRYEPDWYSRSVRLDR